MTLPVWAYCWSSSENNNADNAWEQNFNDGNQNNNNRNNTYSVCLVGFQPSRRNRT